MNYERLYQYRFRNVPQDSRKLVWEEIAAWAHEELGRPRRVLDPAAGRGEFINAVPARERWAVDEVAYLEAVFSEAVRFVHADVMEANLPLGHFDAIWVSNFLEHLGSQDRVAAFLEKMRDCTAPGGQIAIMGPNFRYCADKYFDFADHSVILTHRGVEEHLYAAGFQPRRVEPRFLPYSFSGRLPASSRLVRSYLRFPLAWRLAGKQFLVIGERPAAL